MYLLDSEHEVIVDVWQKWNIKYLSIFLENGKKNIHESSLFALEFDRPSGSILGNLTRKKFLCTFNSFKNTHKVEFFEIYPSFQKIYCFLLSENYILFFSIQATHLQNKLLKEKLFSFPIFYQGICIPFRLSIIERCYGMPWDILL